MNTYLVMAGGTGGHVFPALATADKLKQSGGNVVWLGSNDSFESRVVPKHGIPFFGITVSGLRGKGTLSLAAAPFKLVVAVVQAIKAIRAIKPNVVLGMGGFASGPGGLAAKILGIPLVIHEQNAVAGMTNKILSRFATNVYEAFAGSFGENQPKHLIGNPIREEIVQAANAQGQASDSALTQRAVRVLVLGGSLGAQKLNEVLPHAFAQLQTSKQLDIRHQTGRNKRDATEVAYHAAGVNAHVEEFIEDMAAAYAWADLVVCRAGALTLSELCAAGKGSVLVPYPFAVDDHQTLNAQSLVDAGAALLVHQKHLTVDGAVAAICPLLEQPEKLIRLGKSAKAIAKPDAANQLAEACRSLANG